MVVVRCAVATMYGDVDLVRTLDERKALQMEPHLRVAAELSWLRSFDVRVRAVAADAFGAEDADAEDEIGQPLMRLDAEQDFDRLTRLEDVRGRAVAAPKVDTENLGLARSPSAFACRAHVALRLGVGHVIAARRQCPVLLDRHIQSIRIDNALR